MGNWYPVSGADGLWSIRMTDQPVNVNRPKFMVGETASFGVLSNSICDEYETDLGHQYSFYVRGNARFYNPTQPPPPTPFLPSNATVSISGPRSGPLLELDREFYDPIPTLISVPEEPIISIRGAASDVFLQFDIKEQDLAGKVKVMHSAKISASYPGHNGVYPALDVIGNIRFIRDVPQVHPGSSEAVVALGGPGTDTLLDVFGNTRFIRDKGAADPNKPVVLVDGPQNDTLLDVRGNTKTGNLEVSGQLVFTHDPDPNDGTGLYYYENGAKKKFDPNKPGPTGATGATGNTGPLGGPAVEYLGVEPQKSPTRSEKSGTPRLIMKGGSIGQSENGEFSGDGKHIIIGQSQRINTEGGPRYGVTIQNGRKGKHFCSLRVLQLGDSILSWGNKLLRFRYEGTWWPKNKSRRLRDIMTIDRRGHVVVFGGITSNNYYYSSDLRLKEDIVPINGALGKIMAIQGVSFRFRGAPADDPVEEDPLPRGPLEGAGSRSPSRDDDQEEDQEARRRRLGLIAQEVEKVCPEVVSTDDNGCKSIDMTQINAILVEAIKDQQKIIDAQQARLERMENALARVGIDF